MDEYVVGANEVVAKFNTRSEALSEELRKGISRLTIKLQAKVQTEKLAGQVLNRRTGRLNRSIQPAVFDEGGKIVGVVSTNVFYGIGWELGWPGSAGGQALAGAKAKFKLGGGSQATFQNGSPRKRAFLVPSLRELESAGTIRAEIQASAERAVR